LEDQIAALESEERQLSDRERTVLLLAAEGLTDKEIAKHLSLSQRTIGTYWERMRQKLGPFSRTQLVARFLRLEAELERSSESYVNLFAGWDEGVWVVSSAGKTIYANAPVAALLRMSHEELMQSDGPGNLEALIGDRARSFISEASQKPVRIEVQLSQGSGSRWLTLRGSPVSDRRGQTSATVVIIHDNTFQKRVRQTLDTCRQSLDLISELSTDLIVRFDGDLNCVSVNRSCCERLGIGPDAILNRPLSEIEHFEPVAEWEQAIRSVLVSGAPTMLTSQWKDCDAPRKTHVVPEPSTDHQPNSVLCITLR
jgi:PAS domain S-box-containing protein